MSRASAGLAKPPLAPAPHIRYREIEGCGVILDLEQGCYSVLDEIGAAMWDFLTTAADHSSVPIEWQQSWGGTPDQWHGEIQCFSAECEALGLLHSAGSLAASQPLGSTPPRTPWWWRTPAQFQAMTCLLDTAYRLRSHGFAKAYLHAAGSCHSRRPNGDVLSSALRIFLMAEAWLPFRRFPNDCLLRSLALFRFLRLQGLAPQHFIGVRRIPFGAHAWVECEGQVLLDGGCNPVYRPIARLVTVEA